MTPSAPTAIDWRSAMPSLDKTRCKAGDVLLFYGFNAVGYAQSAVKKIKFLPAVQLSAAASAGRPDCNHAAIISQIGPNATFNMAHATSRGVLSSDIDNYFANFTGECAVYRLSGQEPLAAGAGAVGATWSNSPANEAEIGMPFANLKSLCSVFGRPSFDAGAKMRAAFYRLNRTRAGGPQDTKNQQQGRAKAMFCSMFVVACYQAAMEEAQAEEMLALDAKYTSPMYLDGYLKGSAAWQQVNASKD